MTPEEAAKQISQEFEELFKKRFKDTLITNTTKQQIAAFTLDLLLNFTNRADEDKIKFSLEQPDPHTYTLVPEIFFTALLIAGIYAPWLAVHPEVKRYETEDAIYFWNAFELRPGGVLTSRSKVTGETYEKSI